ncbi:MAG: hypothetical protein SVV03_03395, partial [Candidatus Nanohaloarchaea archaeon]|nr:hypothetical protein [Candidatus Nanohaloarchaea archaeon]
MKYVEEVEDLFREQGFRTEKHSENGGNPTEITAERGGTSLRIAVATRDRKQIRDTGEDLMSREVEEDRSIIFTNLELTSGEKKEIEGELDEKGIGISFFYPEKEDSEVEKPDNMPSSYEIIGDIAILSLEGGQIENSEEIARAVQQQNPNVKTVLNKEEQLSGEYRVGGYQKILGNGTETVHTEHGCRYRLDPTEVYFSARLGHERDRLARQIAGKEIIHVWFAGVGPYAVL